MYKNSIKNMPQKVCIRKKCPIFIVYLKWARILTKKYQRVQQTLNWFTRGHTNLELCNCRFKFSWISVLCTSTYMDKILVLLIKSFAKKLLQIHKCKTYKTFSCHFKIKSLFLDLCNNPIYSVQL